MFRLSDDHKHAAVHLNANAVGSEDPALISPRIASAGSPEMRPSSSKPKAEPNAFVVVGHDNGSHFFSDAPDIQRCAACHAILAKWHSVPTDQLPRKRNMDISSTYDGVTVVSPRFVEVCAQGSVTGLQFTPLKEGRFLWAHATRTVHLDAVR